MEWDKDAADLFRILLI